MQIFGLRWNPVFNSFLTPLESSLNIFKQFNYIFRLTFSMTKYERFLGFTYIISNQCAHWGNFISFPKRKQKILWVPSRYIVIIPIPITFLFQRNFNFGTADNVCSHRHQNEKPTTTFTNSNWKCQVEIWKIVCKPKW